jgi:hypothetical protein
MISRIHVCLIAAACAVAVMAQFPKSAKAAPVAYAFIATVGENQNSGPNNVYALAVSSDGSFTQVGTASTPTPNYHLSVTKNFLFGIDQASNIYSYSISSTGALKLVATTNAGNSVPGFDSMYSTPVLQVDETGSTVYAFIPTSQTDWLLASFKIESSGELQFLGTAYADPNAISQIRFVQNGQFALTDGCYNTAEGASFTTDSDDVNDIVTYKRESNGFLTYVGTSHDTPPAQSPYEYCAAGVNASDPTDHFATVFSIFNPPGDDVMSPPFALGTYTVNSSGTPSTTSDYENMPTANLGEGVDAMSIDPTGKLLAAGGNSGLQLFHFNGASPITSYSGVLQSGNFVRALCWDKSSQLFVLQGESVDIYNVIPTSYTKLKPWTLKNPTGTTPYSMIVLTL